MRLIGCTVAVHIMQRYELVSMVRGDHDAAIYLDEIVLLIYQALCNIIHQWAVCLYTEAITCIFVN